MTKFHISVIKGYCDDLYGAAINPRTWRRWLRVLKFAPYLVYLTKRQARLALTITALKAQSPCCRLNLLDVIRYSNQISFNQLENTTALPKNVVELAQRLNIDRSTVYRWANKYNLRLLPKTNSEFEKWSEVAQRKYLKKVC